jgi:selenocysteine-specific elongation factor
VEELRSWIGRCGLEGPSRAEVEQALGVHAEVAVQFLLDAGEAVELRGLLYHRKSVERAVQVVSEALRTHAALTVAAVRDLLGTSRKYVLPLLEYLDTLGITRRQGELRVAGPKLVRGAS